MKTKHTRGTSVQGSKTARKFARAKRREHSYQMLEGIKVQCGNLKIEFAICNNGTQWKFSRHGVVMNYYPSTRNFLLQGRECRFLNGLITDNAGAKDFILTAVQHLGLVEPS